MGILNKKIVRNAGWNIGGKLLAQVAVPLFSILIARILNPADFGLFALVAAIIGFVDIIKDLGISQIIIIEHDDDSLISMQFTIQLLLGVITYAIIFILAGHIALFFRTPVLKTALIIYALMIFVYCIECPLETFYMKSNKYNILFYRQILPVLFYGVITYLLAIKGFGVFALIIGHLAGRVMTACFLLVKSGWSPSLYIDIGAFLRLFNSGKHILTQSICGYFITQADSFIVSRLLGTSSLGFYRTGNVLINLIPNAVTLPAQKVVFSDVARRKSDYQYYNARYYQFFYVIGMAAVLVSLATYYLSPLVIDVAMGYKWHQMIPVAQVLSATLPTGMIAGINNDYSKILGFNRIYTIFNIIRAAATLTAIYVGSLFSLKLAVTCLVLTAVSSNTANEIFFFSNQRIVKYKSSKLAFFIFAWVWTAYVIVNSCIKP